MLSPKESLASRYHMLSHRKALRHVTTCFFPRKQCVTLPHALNKGVFLACCCVRWEDGWLAFVFVFLRDGLSVRNGPLLSYLNFIIAVQQFTFLCFLK